MDNVYLPIVFELVQSRTDAKGIAAYLTQVQAKNGTSTKRTTGYRRDEPHAPGILESVRNGRLFHRKLLRGDTEPL
jgi:hypothetical protein